MSEQRPDLAALMPTVARALFGEPNKALSTRTELRYRGKGSLSIDLAKGAFFDHEAKEGGGVLDLIRRERKCSTGEALRWIESIGEYVAPVQPLGSDRQRSASFRDLALRLWRECRPTRGTLAERYLASRGIANGVQCEDLRFHARCPFGKDEAGDQRFVPAMVALIRSPFDMAPIGVHRTELDRDGRRVAKKMLGAGAGEGVVMLAQPDVDHRLGISEGIESGLSVMALGWGPVWACMSAGGVADFPHLGGIASLTIYADADKAGLSSAQQCGRRWLDEGAQAQILKPETWGADFNDELMASIERGDVA